MSASSQDRFPNVWRALGLSVAAGYASLGSYAAFMPITCAAAHGLRPINNTLEGDKHLGDAMVWIGARDISMAAALFALYYQERPREMGIVILSGMIFCITDSVYVFQARRDLYSGMISAGAAFGGWKGWNLLKL